MHVKHKKKSAITMVRMTIIRSPDGETDWEPIPGDQVPDWIKSDEEMIKRLADGAMASKPEEGDNYWYQGVQPDQLSKQLNNEIIH